MTNRQRILFLLLLFILAGGIWAYSLLKKDEKPAGSRDTVSPAPAASSSQTISGVPVALADEFTISVFQDDLPGARVMIFDNGGVMLLSLTREGRVVALPDKDNDGKADEIKTLIDRLRRPHGLAMDCSDGACRLFVAEENQVAVYDYDAKELKASGKEKIIDLPAGSGHYTRTLLISGTEGKKRLLVSVGSSCNVCYEPDWRRATILSAELDGSDLKMHAAGLRNSVFMAENPENGKIYATEMGRDFLGDDLPPDEVNIIEEGKNYGWPLCYGKNIHDSEFDKRRYIQDPCRDKAPSLIDIPAHNAPLGIAFFGEGWPEDLRGDALIALHGSWNSSVPVGYKIVRARMGGNGEFLKLEDFLTGLLTSEGKDIGRPAGIAISSGGKIFFSDDSKGVVYLLRYRRAE